MRIGFSVYSEDTYTTCQASTRIRVYDVMSYFEDETNVVCSFYEPGVEYDAMIFQKCFQEGDIHRAKLLKNKGTKIIFDINVNYVYLEGLAKKYVSAKQKANVLRMLDLSDNVIVSSGKLNEIYSKHHNNVVTIEESIESRFFETNKFHDNDKTIFLVYCGYAIKAKDVLLIREVLINLHERFSVKMLFICEEDPRICVIPYEFLTYDYKNLPSLLIKGDIKIAPRDLSDSYNWGHSFSKVAYPMSVGIPAVASPVPSYINREVTICNSKVDWYNNLERLILSPDLRKEEGLAGKKVVKEGFSIDVIGKKYLELFRGLL